MSSIVSVSAPRSRVVQSIRGKVNEARTLDVHSDEGKPEEIIPTVETRLMGALLEHRIQQSERQRRGPLRAAEAPFDQSGSLTISESDSDLENQRPAAGSPDHVPKIKPYKSQHVPQLSDGPIQPYKPQHVPQLSGGPIRRSRSFPDSSRAPDYIVPPLSCIVPKRKLEYCPPRELPRPALTAIGRARQSPSRAAIFASPMMSDIDDADNMEAVFVSFSAGGGGGDTLRRRVRSFEAEREGGLPLRSMTW